MSISLCLSLCLSGKNEWYLPLPKGPCSRAKKESCLTGEGIGGPDHNSKSDLQILRALSSVRRDGFFLTGL